MWRSRSASAARIPIVMSVPTVEGPCPAPRIDARSTSRREASCTSAKSEEEPAFTVGGARLDVGCFRRAARNQPRDADDIVLARPGERAIETCAKRSATSSKYACQTGCRRRRSGCLEPASTQRSRKPRQSSSPEVQRRNQDRAAAVRRGLDEIPGGVSPQRDPCSRPFPAHREAALPRMVRSRDPVQGFSR